MLSFDFYPTTRLEQTAWERAGLMIATIMRTFENHEDIATAIILSRMAREMRRHHGVERTKTMLAALAQPPDDVEPPATSVFVPNTAFRLNDTGRRIWDQMGDLIDQLSAVCGAEIAYSIVASRVMVWMQYRHGTDPARRGLAKVMEGAIDSMADAGRLDQLIEEGR